MNQKPSFTIYNASAGSGKTFTLVKEYLKIILVSTNPEYFKRILAITFTNKAVAEMKNRIIETLKEFANPKIIENSNSMFDAISTELKLDPRVIHEKSIVLLNTILHNYAAFDISTIDGFTHKLIRTFAYDLKLPLNFEVELNQEALIIEAVDNLIAKAGTESTLTKLLIDFAIEKADDDKSWDVSLDFLKVAKLLLNENDLPFVESLKDKTLSDFSALKKQLKVEILQYENATKATAQDVLNTIDSAGLKHEDFNRSLLPKHFTNLSNAKFDINFDAQWQEDLENTTLYPKRVSKEIASIIEQLQPQLTNAFLVTKKSVFHIKFLNAFYKNITPLSVLNALNNELSALKESQNKLLISEFNSIISNEIKNQPTPFIYERIGEKFKHYFIDEFQDTSVLQWENIIPLIDNALATTSGSVMLVGDAKQAIYRWRGGKAEQFIALNNKKSLVFPHTIQNVKDLSFNYRSSKEIVSFNNGFFNYLSSFVFSKQEYQILFENAKQEIHIQSSGYVDVSFLEISKEEDRNTVFSNKVLQTINTCLSQNYALKDICVLVRKKKEGVAIANYLTENGISITSSETLLISNSPEVNFINNFITLMLQPKNNEVKIKVLNYLATLFQIKNKHAFYCTNLNLSLHEFFKSLEIYNIKVNAINLLQLPLFDLCESIISTFNLVDSSNAYIQFYLDVVLDYSHKKGSNLPGFLDYFEKQKDNLSIISPVGQNAIQIMTIHKSKGLEFPVVIFPYADLDIYREKEPKEWFPINHETYQGFSHTLLNFNKDFEKYGEVGCQIFKNHRAEQELDNINLLYVALTRAVEQLYILSSVDASKKGNESTNNYSGLLINYLKHLGIWTDSQFQYTFGSQAKSSLDQLIETENVVQTDFITNSKESQNIRLVTKSGYLWDSNQQDAIEKGNLIHALMAKIKSQKDIDFVIIDFISSNSINLEQAAILKLKIEQLVQHPKLLNYFDEHLTIYNERDIINKDGTILRPDKLVINAESEAIIIDYKTGLESKKHEQQLQLYQDVLEAMKITVKKKILVYINNDISVKEV